MRTAEFVASRHGLGVKTTPLLREFHLGVAQGLTREQFCRSYPEECRLWQSDPAVHRPPGGETIEDIIERCAEFSEQVSGECADGEKLAVIAHGGSIRGLVCAVFGLPPSFHVSMSVSNASLSLIEIGQRPHLRLYNDTCHLNGLDATVSGADAGQG